MKVYASFTVLCSALLFITTLTADLVVVEKLHWTDPENQWGYQYRSRHTVDSTTGLIEGLYEEWWIISEDDQHLKNRAWYVNGLKHGEEIEHPNIFQKEYKETIVRGCPILC